MRQLSNIEIDRIQLLTEKSVELCLIEPTENGLKKSIMDATATVRSYLKSNQVHDYELQKQGPDNKIQFPSYFVSPQGLTNSSASLYRPNTKKGDPRIWFKGLGQYVNANDIFGIIYFQDVLYILNITRLDIQMLLNTPISNPLQELVNEINQISNVVSSELLALLNEIASRGPALSLLDADTSVGFTLETLLGIERNSAKKPDYKGIELKSFRDTRANRKTLFAQVPDWGKSKFKSSSAILDNFGYDRGDDFKLYCTVSSIVRNSQGLKLKMDTNLNQLLENSDIPNIGDFVVWGLDTLHKRLLHKHNETFWVAADPISYDGKNYFQYKKVEHTKKPIITQFDILLEQGIITLDHLIKRSPSGKVIEKGPLFKIKPRALNLLFPPSQIYELEVPK
jgi:hypothetical protein